MKYGPYYFGTFVRKLFNTTYFDGELRRYIATELKREQIRNKRSEANNKPTLKKESVDMKYVLEKAMEDEIKPIVNRLNSLGYKVKYASPGHYHLRKREDDDRDGVYYKQLYTDARIMFDGNYKFSDAPKYWKWRKVDKCDYLDVKPITYNKNDGNPDQAFAKWKSKYMASLKNWVSNLDGKKVSEVTSANDNTAYQKDKKTEHPDDLKKESVDDKISNLYFDFKLDVL
jgi:hypothetical protein